MGARMASAVGDPIEAGREAVRRRAWEDAYELLSRADDRLAAEDLQSRVSVETRISPGPASAPIRAATLTPRPV
jgi:hypothetical protein